MFEATTPGDCPKAVSNGSVTIVGLGNALAGDEGIGPAVVVELRKLDLPERIRLVDGGTDFLSAMQNLNGTKKVIIIDAVLGSGEPGSLYRFDTAELLALNSAYLSAHRMTLVHTIRLLRKLFPEMEGVEFVLWGVHPKSVEQGSAVSDEAMVNFPSLKRLVLSEAGVANGGGE